MEWQNYNHLFYFWMVVKEGGVSRASGKMRLAQSTISAQLKSLEDQLNEKLFRKEGRGLVMTEAGQLVFRYADEIFSLGQEMREALRGRPSGKAVRFVVGITDSIPKLIAYQLLQPAFQVKDSIYLVSQEDQLPILLSELALHRIDLVLSDSPLPPGLKIKAYNHLLGECGISFFGEKELKNKFSGKFPHFLNQAPFLLPAKESSLRKKLEQWFSEKMVFPNFVAEFADNALLDVFAQSGKGFFAAPSVLEKEIQRQFKVELLGRTSEITEQFFAISAERKLKHPAVIAICEAARNKLF